MKRLDLYWTTNPDWWERKENYVKVLKPDAPKEAQESYKHYLEQHPENKENHYDEIRR